LIYVADKVESLDVLTGSLNPIVTASMGAKTPAPGMACFSPDAGKITFKEETGRGEDSLVVFDLRERKRQVLLEMPFLDGPRWSPDGGTIAFSGRSSHSGAYNLFSYGLDNKKLATLVQDSLKDGEMVFSWAPDGKHIVYQSSANAIYDFSFAKGESSKIDDGWFPTWSPSGEYIAYRADGPGDPGYDVIYDLKTRAKQRMLQGVSVYRSLIWSPDSRLLVYAADGRGEFYGDLFILDLKTKKSTRVLRLEQSVYPTDWRRRENP
jgi:Tol biopolymer transport system component